MNYGALSSLPRKTTIGGQPHMLAYINPEEENIIQEYRGNLPVTMGPDGVPAYWSWGESSFNPSNWGGGGGSSAAAASSNDDKEEDSPGIFESVGNAISSGVSAVVGAVSDIGSAVVDIASDVGSAAVDTVTEIVTLGTADTDTYNPDATSTSATTDTTATTATTTDTTTAVFYDMNGVAHSTQAAADAANAEILKATGPAAMDDAVADFYANEEAAENNNTMIESVANFFTPNDGTTYIDSVLVPDDVGIEATVAANSGSSYDADTGKITGSDGSTIKIGTNVNAGDITSTLYSELLPGGSAGNIDDFNTRYEATAAAAELDPYGSTTATGFLVNEGFTADLDGDGVAETYDSGGSYTVNTDGSVVVAGSEGDTTGGLSLLGQTMVDLGLADPANEDGSNIYGGMTDLTDLGGGDPDGIFGGEGGGAIIDSGGDSSPQGYSTNLFGTRDIMGDFYGGRSGGMWDRFANSYLTRFGYSPEQFDEMVRKVENPDGSVNFFGADGQLINPESIGSNYRLSGDPTVLKIGEEDVAIGSQDYDAQGNLISTSYTDAYNPDLDADILAQNQVYSVTDPASGQLVTFPNQAQYDQFVAANNAALAS